MDSGLELSPELTPEPCMMSKADVMAFAETVGARVGYSPDASLEEVAKSLGGAVEPLSLEHMQMGVNGGISVRGIKDFTIFTSEWSGASRNRFTIAHELGHYFLHAPLKTGYRLEAFRYSSDRVEWEANWFAAAFLMPEALFRQVWEDGQGSIIAVSDAFQVSFEAATYRAKYLGLRA